MSRLRNKYRVGETNYEYDPAKLMRTYELICDYSDEEFMDNLAKILHFSSFMCFVLNLSNIETLSDKGIIHELIHLLNDNTRDYTDIKDVRKKFEDLFGEIPVSFYFDNNYSEV